MSPSLRNDVLSGRVELDILAPEGVDPGRKMFFGKHSMDQWVYERAEACLNTWRRGNGLTLGEICRSELLSLAVEIAFPVTPGEPVFRCS